MQISTNVVLPLTLRGSCGYSIEKNIHYFLQCRKYNQHDLPCNSRNLIALVNRLKKKCLMAHVYHISSYICSRI